VNLQAWSRDHPADAVDLLRPGALASLLDTYGGARPDVLANILAHAYAIGAQSAVLEYRYVDPDYRNEHSRFYSTTFRRYPAVAHRLHLFADQIPATLASEDEIARFDDLGYLGYTVLRPLPGAPVGRTMLATAPNNRPHVTCVATDKVNLVGEPLAVVATPFVSQDAQMSVCAHATLWMIAYYHHLAFGGPRLLPGDIAAAVPDDIGRGTPSIGLTLYQISVAASRLGYPALVYGLDPPPPDETIQRLACRYLNSGIPVIVGGAEHAFVLVGYERLNPGEPNERIRFIRHDDEAGIYLNVDNFLLDEYAPWDYMVIPLPQKVYMPGEDAEKIGDAFLRQALDDATDPAATDIRGRLANPARPLSLRSTVIQSNEFKTGQLRRQVPDILAAVYRRMQMSRWIWVVELIDRDLRRRGEPCVVAEAIIDATDQLRDAHALSWRIPGLVSQWSPDNDTVSQRRLDAIAPLPSVGRARG
jgi:hypothetical protein